MRQIITATLAFLCAGLLCSAIAQPGTATDRGLQWGPSVDVQAVHCTAPRERSVGVNRSSCRLYASPARTTLEKASQHRETALSHNGSSL